MYIHSHLHNYGYSRIRKVPPKLGVYMWLLQLPHNTGNLTDGACGDSK